jgi:hypothetical protein
LFHRSAYQYHAATPKLANTIIGKQISREASPKDAGFFVGFFGLNKSRGYVSWEFFQASNAHTNFMRL